VNIVDDANKLYVSPLKGGVRVSGIAEIAGYNTEVLPKVASGDTMPRASAATIMRRSCLDLIDVVKC